MIIHALCGSLRAASLNAAALRSAAELFQPPRRILIEPDLGRFPFFNADTEMTDLPPGVAEFRARLGTADGMLIATPEYAHGTSGVLKNALEWLVGGGELMGKPVALMSASTAGTGGNRAQAWLAETLTIMGANVLPNGLLIPFASGKITDGRVTDPATLEGMGALVDSLAVAVAEYRQKTSQLS